MPGTISIIVDPQDGVCGIDLRPDPTLRFQDPCAFRLLGRLWPVLRALDEAIRHADVDSAPQSGQRAPR